MTADSDPVRDDRPGLDSRLRGLRKGDVLVVWKLDRLGRNLAHLVNTVQDLSTRGVGLRVLAGLGAVDWVVSFSEDTPEDLLRDLRPDVLVKGGDYTLDEVVGGDLVKSWNGDVRVLAFIDDCSTSAIVEKMRNAGEQSPPD